MKEFLFVIPFLYNEERFKLFDFSLSYLKYLIKKYEINCKILIHEIGKEKKLNENFLNKNCDIYKFSFFEGIFDRAWSFNKAIKNYKFENDEIKLILMDSDIIVKDDWMKNLNKFYENDFMIGWKSVLYLNELYTQKVIEEQLNVNKIQITDWKTVGICHKPDINGSAGGITIISKKLFFDIKGMAEYFSGTWRQWR